MSLEPRVKGGIHISILPSYFYNIKEILGYSKIKGVAEEHMIRDNFKYMFIPPSPIRRARLVYKKALEGETSIDYCHRLASFFTNNILEYVTANEGVAIPKLREHYEVEMTLALKKAGFNPAEHLDAIQVSWAEVDLLINYMLNVGRDYKKSYYRQYFQWWDGLNFFYQHVPFIGTNDHEYYDFVFFIQRNDIPETTNVFEHIAVIPSCCRVIGRFLQDGFKINNIRIIYFNTVKKEPPEKKPSKKDTLSPSISHTCIKDFPKVYENEEFNEYISYYSRKERWLAPEGYYPSPRDFFDFTPEENNDYRKDNIQTPEKYKQFGLRDYTAP